MAKLTEYTLVVEPLSEEDGGGYVAFFPDLRGCMSDGATPEEAVSNAQQALESWMEVQEERGAHIPKPGEASSESLGDVLGGLSASVEMLEKKIADLESRVSKIENSPEIEASVSRGWSRRSVFSRGDTIRFTQPPKSLVG